MDQWLDLHMHSAYSADGEFIPEVLMEKCAQAGLKAVALADHNTVRGNRDAQKAAVKLGLSYFPAIEIDCMHQGKNFHLLGYGIDPDRIVFEEIERVVHEQEVINSEKLMENVFNMGFYFEEQVVREQAKDGVIIAEIIAAAVLRDPRNKANERLLPFRPGGIRSDNPLVNFFWDFCSQGKEAYVPVYYVSLATAIYAVQTSGGVAVLAHPGANMGMNSEMIKSMIQMNLDGIEVYTNYHDEKTRGFYEKICNKYNLLVTAGSDFHGKMKPAIGLGKLEQPAANQVYEALTRKIKQRGGEVTGCLQM